MHTEPHIDRQRTLRCYARSYELHHVRVGAQSSEEVHLARNDLVVALPNRGGALHRDHRLAEAHLRRLRLAALAEQALGGRECGKRNDLEPSVPAISQR